VTGKIARIGSEYVFVDIRGKNESMISRAEVSNKDGTLSIAVGDEVTAYVASNSSGETMLSKSLTGKGRTAAVQEILDALNNRVPVQGKVTGSARQSCILPLIAD
jgi:ribosomal protein S1